MPNGRKMNFSFLNPLAKLEPFKCYCCEAKHFVQTYPDATPGKRSHD